MDKKVGFIGAGNMASSLISGMISAGFKPEDIMASSPGKSHLDSLSNNFNPSANTLTVSTIACANITSTNGFGTASQNAYGVRTVSTGNPSGGNDGDIWYKY